MPVDAGITLRRTHDPLHGRVDPHYWLSATNAKAIARTVAGELTRLAPDRRVRAVAAGRGTSRQEEER